MQTQQADTQAALSPKDALTMLREGNERFQAARQADRDLLRQVEETKDGQWPFAVLLSCIDSRTSPELVFDLGIGDTFNARIAGNFANEDILGSMEFACKLAGSKLVVVLGHTHCGAIKGACDDAKLGNLTTMLEKLKPAVDATETPAGGGERNSSNADFVQGVAETNVHRTVEGIRASSEVLRTLEAEGAIGIVGAMYDITTGAVTFFPSTSPALA